MALPKIDLPLFEMTLPSTGEKIKYRPFTVKEEKILLVAQEAKDPEQEILAAKQVTNNCLVDKEVSSLAMFDLEYILIQLKSKSVDNTITFAIKDPDTEETIKLELDVENIKLQKNKDHSNEIKINEDYILYLKYPTIDEYVQIVKMDPKDPLVSYFLMTSCLDKIASEEEVYHFKDYTSEEIDSFMENLSSGVVKGIQQFFETMPRLRHEMKYTNKDGNDKTFVIEGLRSFFI
jgi:hypothetical protein